MRLQPYESTKCWILCLSLLIASISPLIASEVKDEEWYAINKKINDLIFTGHNKHVSGDKQGALEHFEKGLELAREAKNESLEEAFLRSIGEIRIRQNKFKEALGYFQQALRLSHKNGNLLQEYWSLRFCGFVYTGLGDFKTATEQWTNALQVARKYGEKELEVKMTRRVGAVNAKIGNDAQAITYLQKAISLNDYLGEDSTSILEEVYSLQQRLGQSDEAKKTLRRKTELAEKHKRMTDVYRLRKEGLVYRDKKEYGKAVERIQRALDACRTIQVPDCENDSLSMLGDTEMLTKDHAASIRYYKRYLERPNISKNKKAIAYQNMGNMQLASGRLAVALWSFGHALYTYRSFGNLGGERELLVQVADTYLMVGDHAMALKHAERALEMHKAAGNRRGQANAFSVLAKVYDALGHTDKAMKLNYKALHLHRYFQQLGEEAQVRIRLAEHFANSGDFGAAHRQMAAATSSAEKINDRLGNRERALHNIGVAYYQLGDKAKALSMTNSDHFTASVHLDEGDIEKAFPIIEHNYEQFKHSRIIGRYYLLSGRLKQAADFYAANIRGLRMAESFFLIIEDYIGLGLTKEALRDYTEAKSAFTKAVHWLEFQRNSRVKTERQSFFATGKYYSLTDPYEGLVRISQAKNDDKAFFWSESIKARRFLDLTTERADLAHYKIPKSLLHEEKRIIKQMESVRKDIEQSFLGKKPFLFRMGEDSGITSPQEKGLVRSLQENEKISLRRSQELSLFAARLRKKFPKYTAIKYPQPLSAAHISLNDDEILLAYEITETELFMFLIQKGKVAQTIKVSVRRRDLETKVRAFRASFADADAVLAGKFDPKLGKDLFNILIAPALKALDPKKKIIIVPDEILGILPFDALVMSHPERIEMPVVKLPNGTKVPTPMGTTYVGDRYDITYDQSATALTLQRTLQARENSGERMLVVADPIFGMSDSRMRGKRKKLPQKSSQRLKEMGAVVKHMGPAGTPRTGISRTRTIARSQDIVFPRLDKTSILANQFRNKTDALLGAKADEGRLMKMDLSSYKYILIATHGILDESVPYLQEPMLVLSQVGTDAKYDGFLTMSEVMGLELNADIVALTACKTGLGKRLAGEGVMGFARAFRIAGAKTVLVSLWSVAEESTTIFAENFFRHLRKGKTKREALRIARRDIRRRGFDHPFFWAPFILVGD